MMRKLNGRWEGTGWVGTLGGSLSEGGRSQGEGGSECRIRWLRVQRCPGGLDPTGFTVRE